MMRSIDRLDGVRIGVCSRSRLSSFCNGTKREFHFSPVGVLVLVRCERQCAFERRAKNEGECRLARGVCRLGVTSEALFERRPEANYLAIVQFKSVCGAYDQNVLAIVVGHNYLSVSFLLRDFKRSIKNIRDGYHIFQILADPHSSLGRRPLTFQCWGTISLCSSIIFILNTRLVDQQQPYITLIITN